jgi:hypothetical protein
MVVALMALGIFISRVCVGVLTGFMAVTVVLMARVVVRVARASSEQGQGQNPCDARKV